MFERFFVSFEMHLTRSLDSNLFAPADTLARDRNWRAEHDHEQACRIPDPIGYTQRVRSNVRY